MCYCNVNAFSFLLQSECHVIINADAACGILKCMERLPLDVNRSLCEHILKHFPFITIPEFPTSEDQRRLHERYFICTLTLLRICLCCKYICGTQIQQLNHLASLSPPNVRYKAGNRNLWNQKLNHGLQRK